MTFHFNDTPIGFTILPSYVVVTDILIAARSGAGIESKDISRSETGSLNLLLFLETVPRFR